jgi:hypothetical protein
MNVRSQGTAELPNRGNRGRQPTASRTRAATLGDNAASTRIEQFFLDKPGILGLREN